MFDSAKERAILKDALRLYAQKQLDALPSDEIVEKVTFSVDFERKMQKLIRAQRRATWKYFNTAGKKAVAILVAAILAATTAMAVPAIREPIVQFLTETFTGCVKYTVSEDVLQRGYAEKIEIAYSPTVLPKGYEQTNTFESDKRNSLLWSNEQGNKITFEQCTLDSSLIAVTEDVAVTETRINGVLGNTYTYKGQDLYIWSEHGYIFVLMVPESFTREQADLISSTIEAKAK